MSEADDRRAKLERLRAQGIDPFPHEFEGVVATSSVVDDLEPGEETDRSYRVAGRMVARRDQGGAAFIDLVDRTGKLQLHAKKDVLGDESFDRLVSLDLGDLIGVDGTAFKTRRGQLSLLVTDWKLLAKSLRSVPKEYYGVEDVETRYRHREVDLLANEETRELFILRSKVVRACRNWLDERGFLEVETPVLQPLYGGALARPFVTHHNALDRDFFLRISPETYLKRVIAGSFDRVYELGRNFRNEGIDSSHLQEFTMLEWYVAYWDYRDNMAFTQQLVQTILQDVCGSTTVTYQGVELDFGGDWPVIDYRDAVREATGIDLAAVRDVDELKVAIKAAGLGDDLDDTVSYAALVDLLYKRTVRPGLIQPCFLVHHPAELVPLARRSDDDGTRLDMFQVVVNGWEIVKAYSELIDPFEQKARLLEQVELRAAGDDETMMMEDDFIEAMEYGMPPMSGLGLGIDRFVALLTDAPTLRDVVLFPQMRDDG